MDTDDIHFIARNAMAALLRRLGAVDSLFQCDILGHFATLDANLPADSLAPRCMVLHSVASAPCPQPGTRARQQRVIADVDKTQAGLLQN